MHFSVAWSKPLIFFCFGNMFLNLNSEGRDICSPLSCLKQLLYLHRPYEKLTLRGLFVCIARYFRNADSFYQAEGVHTGANSRQIRRRKTWRTSSAPALSVCLDLIWACSHCKVVTGCNLTAHTIQGDRLPCVKCSKPGETGIKIILTDQSPSRESGTQCLYTAEHTQHPQGNEITGSVP